MHSWAWTVPKDETLTTLGSQSVRILKEEILLNFPVIHGNKWVKSLKVFGGEG